MWGLAILISEESDLSDKIKQEFFQAVAASVLLYGRTFLTLMKCPEKRLDGSYTWMPHTIFNKYGKQHPSKQQLYGHLPTILQTILVRQPRRTGG